MLTCSGIVFGTLAILGQAQQDGVPKDVRDNWEALVGDWTVHENAENGEQLATWSVRWGEGKNCLIMTWRDARGMIGTGITGWDRATDEIVEFGFGPSGTCMTIRYKRISPKKLKGTANGTLPDGKYSDERVIDRVSDGEFILRSSKVIAGGQKQPDREIVFRKK